MVESISNTTAENAAEKAREEAQKRAELQNAIWNGDSVGEINGEMLTLKECHERALREAREIFLDTSQIAEMEIPKGKYILYVSATLKGIMRSEEIPYIDEERIKKAKEIDTGSGETPIEKFQEANMRYCLGFKDGDQRFKAVNIVKEGIPEDLSDCVGVVFSGSEADMHDTKAEHSGIVDKAEKILAMATKLQIPKLGICFGSQLLANEAGFEVGWIEEDGKKKKVTGVQKVISTADATYPGLKSFPESFFVAQAHAQEVKIEKGAEGALILAVNENGAPEVVIFPAQKSMGIQGHIEVGPGRLALVTDVTEDPFSVFKNDILEGRRIFFPFFLKKAGSFAKENIKNKSA